MPLPYEDVEGDLQRAWEGSRHQEQLRWEQARPAVRDAWDRSGYGAGRQQPSAIKPAGQFSDPEPRR